MKIISGLSYLGCIITCYSQLLFVKEHRGTLCAGFQLFVTIGIFLASALSLVLNWCWLSVFALVLGVIVVILLAFVPETPGWLVAHKKEEAAIKAILWLTGSSDEKVDLDLKEIKANLAAQVHRGGVTDSVDLVGEHLINFEIVFFQLLVFM